jgi:hypothetical protein
MFDDDDLFARPPRRIAPQAHITCRVCGKPATVPTDHPALLCPLCLEDVDKTGAHITEVYAAALVRLQESMTAWDAAGKAAPKTLEAIWAYKARGDFDPQVLASRWAHTIGRGGAGAALCHAWDAMEDEAGRLRETEKWYLKAAVELQAARTAIGWPAEV